MKIVIRHGILSNATKMSSLDNSLKLAFPTLAIDNRSYDWRNSILVSGVQLASGLIVAGQANKSDRRVVLVGHSMGGLVCRVANAAMTDPKFKNNVAAYAKSLTPADHDMIQNSNLNQGFVDVCAVVTLASPNSGALRKGQLAFLGLLTDFAIVHFKSAGIQDLQRDHIFRVLQHCRTNTSCVTISGSFGNRFSQGAFQTGYRGVASFIATLAQPHDLVVEDESVDLSKSVLPHEFRGSVEHLRAYLDCIDVKHTNIHETAEVQRRVADIIRAGCNAE